MPPVTKGILKGFFLIQCLVLCSAQNRVRPDLAIEAVYTAERIQIDGDLNEEVWGKAAVAKNFIQNQPREGQPASEPTEVRVLYDQNNLYFGATCFDSEIEKRTVPSIQRDFSPGPFHDLVAVVMDTFQDGRSSYAFAVNPAGAKHDGQFYNDGRDWNINYDGVWHVQTKIHAHYWTAEIAIPFKSMRFAKGEEQAWGINFMRVVRRKGETSLWAPVPYRYSVGRMSLAGRLDGIGEASPGRNLKVTPYVVSEFSSGDEQQGTDTDFEAGVDAKYGLTDGLNLDLTYNTDFSNVEVDTQQVNLTRFSLFFPEKRPFFLENRGFFFFGQTEALSFSDVGFGTVGSGTRGRVRTELDFIPFFTRRVGLSDDGVPIPILGGARLTGQEGPNEVGLLVIQEEDLGDDQSGSNFAVARFRHSLSENVRVGGIFVQRDVSEVDDTNRIFGLDTNLRFFNKLNVDGFWARTQDTAKDDDSAWKVQASWKDAFWDLNQTFIDIGQEVRAAAGFVPRTDIRKSLTQLGVHPRPKAFSGWLREIFPHSQVEYITDQQNQLQTRVAHFGFAMTFQDNGQLEVARTESFERLQDPFEIRPDTAIAPGDYRFGEWTFLYSMDPSRVWSANFRLDKGDFFDGTKTTYNVGATFRYRPRFFVETDYQRNEVSLEAGDFDVDLLGLRLHYGFNTSLFFDGFVQYNTSAQTVSANLRFNFIHRPLSNFYLVFNENRNTVNGMLIERALILKLTYLFDL